MKTKFSITRRCGCEAGLTAPQGGLGDSEYPHPCFSCLGYGNELCRRQRYEEQKVRARCGSLEGLLAEAYELINMSELQHVSSKREKTNITAHGKSERFERPTIQHDVLSIEYIIIVQQSNILAVVATLRRGAENISTGNG